MKQQCIEGNYDFLLSFQDCLRFIYKDETKWVENRKPEKYIVQIIPPGFSNSIDVEVNTEGQNIISKDGEVLQLIDGIYCFKVESCGTIYKRYIGVACKLQCKLNTLISKADIKTKKDFENISNIKFLLEGFYINARLEKSETAIKFYKLAEKELNCYKCNC